MRGERHDLIVAVLAPDGSQVATHDDGGAGSLSRVLVRAETRWWIAVSGFGGDEDSNPWERPPETRYAQRVLSANLHVDTPEQPPQFRVACPECDWVVSFGEIAGGERAHCPRCSRVLTAPKRDAGNRALALALCAGILLLLANSFPFIQLESNGIERVMTLPRTMLELMDSGNTTLALLVSGPIVGVPLLMIAAMAGLLLLLRRGRPSAFLVPIGRLLFALHPWNMGEVFLIGVLVSLVKLTDMASVQTGFAFWAYAGFVVAFVAALSHLDRFQIWREIEACQA